MKTVVRIFGRYSILYTEAAEMEWAEGFVRQKNNDIKL